MGYPEESELKKNPHTLQEVLNGAMGPGAKRKYITNNDSQDVTNTYFALQMISDTTFVNLTDLDEVDTGLEDHFVNNVTFSAGLVIYGRFTDIELDSGAVIGYIKK